MVFYCWLSWKLGINCWLLLPQLLCKNIKKIIISAAFKDRGISCHGFSPGGKTTTGNPSAFLRQVFLWSAKHHQTNLKLLVKAFPEQLSSCLTKRIVIHLHHWILIQWEINLIDLPGTQNRDLLIRWTHQRKAFPWTWKFFWFTLLRSTPMSSNLVIFPPNLSSFLAFWN